MREPWYAPCRRNECGHSVAPSGVPVKGVGVVCYTHDMGHDRHSARWLGLLLLYVVLLMAAAGALPIAAASRTPTSTMPSVTPSGTPEASFVFAAAGDIGAASAVTASLQALAGSGADFFLALGDMSYDDIKPETAWCAYIKDHLGETYPFQLLVGNHEEYPAGPNGFIDNFAACLPDRLGVTGSYAHRYYFDYPPGAPLARFILIDPDLDRGGSRADYCKGGETDNCGWLQARVDEAKQQGLWTIVGMHKNCLSMGVKACEIGAELLNLLIDLKVDLVLQGHDHSYQRSKQLSLTAGCLLVQPSAYNANCVADDGRDGLYKRDMGLVFAITAVMGRAPYPPNPFDSDAPYFAAWMGASTPSNGFLQFTVTKEQIDAHFISSVGSFADHFTIGSEGASPTPTPGATPSPGSTIPPTASPPPSTSTPEGDKAHVYLPHVIP